MFKKAVFPGKYIQGVGAIGELPALITLLGKQGLLLASPSANGKVLPQCGLDLKAQAIPVEVFRGECCEDEVARLSAIVTRQRADVLVGMGGGKTAFKFMSAKDPLYGASMSYLPTMGGRAVVFAKSILNGKSFKKDVIEPTVVVTQANVSKYLNDAY